MNLLPTQMQPDCDIRRLRQSYIEGLGRKFRQTIVLSSGRRPEINSLFSTSDPSSQPFCDNYRGIIKLSSISTGSVIKESSFRGKCRLNEPLPNVLTIICH